MACGKPFIFSDIKPIRVELDYRNHGFLVNPDSEEEIIKAIESFFKNPDLAIEHSENSRKLIEKNKNWENESKKLLALVNNILD